MGEYECIDCNEMFWAEEPPHPKAKNCSVVERGKK
jgi:hypothetical protein